jgi:protein-S-isoprenylcysteine O-methyltransferase Ste14
MQICNSKKLRVALVKQLAITSIFLFVQIVIFFVSAGNLIVVRPWFYFVTAFVHYVVSTTVQFKLNPQLLVQRLKMKREGSKLWDEILMRLSNLMGIILIPAMAGLDFRFGWLLLNINFVFIGLVFAMVSSVLLNWAMIINPHFEPTVRIQDERSHKVITSGPYNVVRHPGYLAGILFAISIPFLIGSFFAFAAVGIYFTLMILRTWLEDKTLQDELEGYSEYTRQVKFRLFPGIW